MRAAVYLRQSQDNVVAIDRQSKACVALCEEKGWTPTEYPENGRSAFTGKERPAYKQMLTDIRAGKVGAVVVWDLDRLHRRPIELEHFMKLADDHQLKLATVTGDCDLSTDNGRLFARIKGAVAMSEVERKSARQKAANMQMAENESRPWWPSRPFGFDAALEYGIDADTGEEIARWWTVKKDPKTKRVIAINPIRKHPVEAKRVKEAYRRFNAGTTVRTIATEWNAAGVLTPKGNRWTGTAVRALLLAARNAGLREYCGELVMERDGDGKPTGRPLKGTWPAIITEDVWRQTVRKLADPKRGTNASRGRKYLLSGLARCGRKECGAALGSAISSRGQPQYACNHCQKIARDGVKLDQLITERVVWRLSRPDAVDLMRPPVDAVDADALREERRALEDRLVQLGKDFANAPPAFTQSALAEINGRLDEIGRALEDPGKAAIFEGVIGAKDVRKAFLGLDLGRQRTIVDALMTITVNPVGKGTGAVFDPDAIDAPWREDL
jgi:DNA invertase Pin-like site-specific DNA recombinase